MRVYLGTDHAGFELKQHLVTWLGDNGHEPRDCGAHVYDAEDHYPPYILRAARCVADDPGSFGIVLGGSGNGEAMAANKVLGVRAVLAWSDETARLGRAHNDANIVSLGARMHDRDEATRLVDTFLATPYSHDPRHDQRIAMVRQYEEAGELPPS